MPEEKELETVVEPTEDECDEEIDYKGLINELRQKDINEKNIIKLLHYVYKLPIFKLMKLTGNSKLFVHTAIREGPINKL